MTSMYGAGKYCPKGPESCQNIDDISKTLATSRDWDQQLEAWTGWHSIAPPMRKDYQRFVELANEGAQGLGYKDLGELWRAGYDMSAAEFESETERLWTQVKRSMTASIATRAPSCSRSTARSACRMASPFLRTCSATSGRSSGTTSMRTSSSPIPPCRAPASTDP